MNARILLATALLALSPLALAQESSTNSKQFQAETGPVTVTWGQPTLAKSSEYHVQVSDLDGNGDGRLSRAEIPEGHALQFEFKVVDRNHDSYLSTAELTNWR